MQAERSSANEKLTGMYRINRIIYKILFILYIPV